MTRAGTPLWNVGAIGEQFVAANLYVVLVVVPAATLTSASVSDITVQVGVSDDKHAQNCN